MRFDATTEEKRAELHKRMNAFVFALINQKTKRREAGTMDCPLCDGKGTVAYSRKTYNGTIRACCSYCGTSLMA